MSTVGRKRNFYHCFRHGHGHRVEHEDYEKLARGETGRPVVASRRIDRGVGVPLVMAASALNTMLLHGERKRRGEIVNSKQKERGVLPATPELVRGDGVSAPSPKNRRVLYELAPC